MPRLLSDTAYILNTMPSNPLDAAFYSCGVAFLLSALAYAPLRRLAAWEARRYLARHGLTISIDSEPDASCCYCASTVVMGGCGTEGVERQPSFDQMTRAAGEGAHPAVNTKRRVSVS